jgi:hypothetical protein
VADLADIRAGLAAAIKAAVSDAQVTGYTIPSPTAPFFDIELSQDGIDYDQAMRRGHDLWNFTVRGVVAANDSLAAQKNLDAWIDDDVIKDALETDQTLGGVVKTVHVTHLSGYGPVSVLLHPNNAYLGAEWTVETRG